MIGRASVSEKNAQWPSTKIMICLNRFITIFIILKSIYLYVKETRLESINMSNGKMFLLQIILFCVYFIFIAPLHAYNKNLFTTNVNLRNVQLAVFNVSQHAHAQNIFLNIFLNKLFLKRD